MLIRSGFGVAIAAMGFLALGANPTRSRRPRVCTGNGKISKQIAKPMAAAQDAQKAKKWQEVLSKMREASRCRSRRPRGISTGCTNSAASRIRSCGQYPEAAREHEAGLFALHVGSGQGRALQDALVTLLLAMRNYPKVIDYANRALKIVARSRSAGDTRPGVLPTNDNKSAMRVMNEVMAEHRAAGPGSERADAASDPRGLRKGPGQRLRHQGVRKAGVELPEARVLAEPACDRSGRATPTTSRRSTCCASRRGGRAEAPDEYTEMAQIAMDEGLPAEAQKVLEQGSRRSSSPTSARST